MPSNSISNNILDGQRQQEVKSSFLLIRSRGRIGLRRWVGRIRWGWHPSSPPRRRTWWCPPRCRNPAIYSGSGREGRGGWAVDLECHLFPEEAGGWAQCQDGWGDLDHPWTLWVVEATSLQTDLTGSTGGEGGGQVIPPWGTALPWRP